MCIRDRHTRLPIHKLQRIVKKVRVDLALQRDDAGVLQRQLLPVYPIEQIEHLVAHSVEGLDQVADLIVPRRLGMHAQLAVFQGPRRAGEPVSYTHLDVYKRQDPPTTRFDP